MSATDMRSVSSPARFRFLLLAASAALGFILSEGLFRWILLEPKVPATEVGLIRRVYSSWPRPILIEKDPGVWRILGLSDSFGEGRPESYHDLLETLFRKEDASVEVVNFSVGEYEPSDELALLKRFGARYHPDLVLHGFFVGNDFDAPEGTLMTYRHISVRTREGLPGFLLRESSLLRWGRRWLKARQERNLRKREIDSGETSGTFARGTFLKIERDRLEVCRVKPAPDPPKWQKTVRILDEFGGKPIGWGRNT